MYCLSFLAQIRVHTGLKGVVLCTPLMKGSLLFKKKNFFFFGEMKIREGEGRMVTKQSRSFTIVSGNFSFYIICSTKLRLDQGLRCVTKRI
jgi:hypothetical protein